MKHMTEQPPRYTAADAPKQSDEERRAWESYVRELWTVGQGLHTRRSRIAD